MLDDIRGATTPGTSTSSASARASSATSSQRHSSRGGGGRSRSARRGQTARARKGRRVLRRFAAGMQVCSTRATRVRLSRRSGPTPCAGTSALGHIDHRKVVVVDAEQLSRPPTSRPLQHGASRPVSASQAPSSRSSSSSSQPASAGSNDSGRRSRGPLPSLDSGAIAQVLHNAPGNHRPINVPCACSRAPPNARRRQPVRHRPRDGRRIGMPPRGVRVGCSFPRTRTTGLRCALSSITRGCSTRAFAFSSTPRCCTRKRSCATASCLRTCNLETWSGAG